jgi:hypothetical protein
MSMVEFIDRYSCQLFKICITYAALGLLVVIYLMFVEAGS